VETDAGSTRENRPVSPSGPAGDGIDGEHAAAPGLVTRNDCRSRDRGGAPVTKTEIDGQFFGWRGAQRPDGCSIDLREGGEQRNRSKGDQSGERRHWVEEHNDQYRRVTHRRRMRYSETRPPHPPPLA
jgi:hypothetical protein